MAANSEMEKRSNSPMWMIESESADFHSWLKKTATSNKAGVTFMLSRDISPPSTPDKPRLPGREPTDLNPEKRSRCFSPSAGRSRKFPSVFAWRSCVGATLAEKNSRGSDSDWHPVEIPTLNHILETPHPKNAAAFRGAEGSDELVAHLPN